MSSDRKTFLFTGTLNRFSREEAEKLVENHGGYVVSAVDEKLKYLVVGHKPGSKLEKAKAYGNIQIITESDFIAIINSSEIVYSETNNTLIEKVFERNQATAHPYGFILSLLCLVDLGINLKMSAKNKKALIGIALKKIKKYPFIYYSELTEAINYYELFLISNNKAKEVYNHNSSNIIFQHEKVPRLYSLCTELIKVGKIEEVIEKLNDKKFFNSRWKDQIIKRIVIQLTISGKSEIAQETLNLVDAEMVKFNILMTVYEEIRKHDIKNVNYLTEEKIVSFARSMKVAPDKCRALIALANNSIILIDEVIDFVQGISIDQWKIACLVCLAEFFNKQGNKEKAQHCIQDVSACVAALDKGTKPRFAAELIKLNNVQQAISIIKSGGYRDRIMSIVELYKCKYKNEALELLKGVKDPKAHDEIVGSIAIVLYENGLQEEAFKQIIKISTIELRNEFLVKLCVIMATQNKRPEALMYILKLLGQKPTASIAASDSIFTILDNYYSQIDVNYNSNKVSPVAAPIKVKVKKNKADKPTDFEIENLNKENIKTVKENIIKAVCVTLHKIITYNAHHFKVEGNFKVRPNYGYGKFYLDWVDGGTDMSLHGLIHYILHEDGHYKKFLSSKHLQDVENTVLNYPDAIYSPAVSDEKYELIQSNCLDGIYLEAIKFTGKKLLEKGFNVREQFLSYLDEDEVS